MLPTPDAVRHAPSQPAESFLGSTPGSPWTCRPSDAGKEKSTTTSAPSPLDLASKLTATFCPAFRYNAGYECDVPTFQPYAVVPVVNLDRILDLARRFPEKTQVIPVAVNLQEMARQNDKRDAYVKVGVDDELVKNLTGDRDRRDLVFLVRLPRLAVDAIASGLEAPGIVRP